MLGRTLAIGDVHGCDKALNALLGMLAVTADDTVVFLGDIVDRGPHTKRAVERILNLRDECSVVVIMGNHEEMMRDAVSGRTAMDYWFKAGGQQTLESYGGSVDDIPPEHIKFLLSTQAYYETDSEIFVHASLEYGVSLLNQTAEWLRWKHVAGSERPHDSGKRVICGHTSQPDGIPRVFDGWACIDTFAHGGKYLSCLDVGSNRVYQASQAGDTREFPLEKNTLRWTAAL